jgi:hypothetical protein
MGAYCAGSITLGEALGAKLGYPYFDTDFYFWEPSELPYTVKRGSNARFEWLSAFDLVVLLYVPPEIRLQRKRPGI